MLALRSDVTDNFRQRHVAITRDLLQRIPELILKTYACLVACENNRTFDDRRFHGVPASYVGTMVPKCGAIWQADTKQ